MDVSLRLMAIMAHPDDESLGIGGTLARYADEGVETYLVCATRGERGRHGSDSDHPGIEAVGKMREVELRHAARVLGIRHVAFLDYIDKDLDQADPGEVIGKIVREIRLRRPQVVVTFGPDGAYGHPDHIAISQFATAAVSAAASATFRPGDLLPHSVEKLYFMAWPEGKWRAYQNAFKTLSITVDGQERRAVPWTDWSLTTRIATEAYWPTAWRAICCHKTQLAIYESLENLSPSDHKALWGSQEFYRVFSLVNGGRKNETDLFEGIRNGTTKKPSETAEVCSSVDAPIATSSNGGKSITGARRAVLDMPANQFLPLGHDLIERIGDFLDGIRSRKVTSATPAAGLRDILEKLGGFPNDPSDANKVLPEVAEQLFRHSLHNGHPRFWGYITSSAAPIGMLADLLAASVNPNVGAAALSPLATQIEAETIRWIAQFLGYPDDCGGILVSGGNMANLLCLLVARRAKLGSDVRSLGVGHSTRQGRPRLYASAATHTWIEKAADIAGLGTDSIRWIATDNDQRIDLSELERQIQVDLKGGDAPFLLIGTAGTVGIGAIDPLSDLLEISRKHGLWFHVDGAYGAPAVVVPELYPELSTLREADSLAVDPHKWLYAPLEAGCALVRDRELHRSTFSYHPDYYHFEEESLNYFDLGPQNSRAFRALKIWLSLKQAGRNGYRTMIRTDIELAKRLAGSLSVTPEFRDIRQGLSIVTFRYVPLALQTEPVDHTTDYLNLLNQAILERLEKEGEFFLSKAVVSGRFLLRVCIVNFRTESSDVDALPEYLLRLGERLDREMRGDTMKSAQPGG